MKFNNFTVFKQQPTASLSSAFPSIGSELTSCMRDSSRCCAAKSSVSHVGMSEVGRLVTLDVRDEVDGGIGTPNAEKYSVKSVIFVGH